VRINRVAGVAAMVNAPTPRGHRRFCSVDEKFI
jgi:hypothetical protein